jgi:hypothetical protein
MVSCTRSSAIIGSLIWERTVFMSMLRSFWKVLGLSIILTVSSTVGAKARQANGRRFWVYLVFSCRRARLAVSLSGFGSMWLKSNLMASRTATSLGWTPQRVARVATPLSRFARVTISGQRYEVFDNCKGGGLHLGNSHTPKIFYLQNRFRYFFEPPCIPYFLL